MSDDFQPGDLVVCITVGPIDRPARMVSAGMHKLRLGHIYRVARVGFCPVTREVGLRLVGHPHSSINSHVRAIRFRKLPPADEQFTADLKARIRRHDRVPA